jgi:hypothetical protein
MKKKREEGRNIGRKLTRPDFAHLKIERRSPVKAIRAYCLECSAGQPSEVRKCEFTDCSLWPYRFGTNPWIEREMTDEQKAKNCKAMLEGRKRKKRPSNKTKKNKKGS